MIGNSECGVTLLSTGRTWILRKIHKKLTSFVPEHQGTVYVRCACWNMVVEGF